MKKLQFFLAWFLLSIVCPFLLFAQEDLFPKILGDFTPSVEEFAELGYIDWGNGYYYTVSKGYPPKQKKSRLKKKRPKKQKLLEKKAKDAAIAGAKAQILAMAQKIRVDADATIGDLQAEGYKIKIEGTVKAYTIVEEGWVPHPVRPYYEIVVKAPLDSVSSQLIDSQITKLKTGNRGEVKEEVKKEEPKVEEKEEVKQEVKEEEKTEKEKKIEEIKGKADKAFEEMNLLIDARDTGLNQAMFPEVKDEDGTDIFNITLPTNIRKKHKQMTKYVEASKKIDDLLNKIKDRKDILYVRAIAPIEKIVLLPERTVILTADGTKVRKRRSRRFVCKASKSAGKLRANIIISKEDAERIVNENKKAKFFEKANVYVIVDSSIGGTEGWLRWFESDVLLTDL